MNYSFNKKNIPHLIIKATTKNVKFNAYARNKCLFWVSSYQESYFLGRYVVS